MPNKKITEEDEGVFNFSVGKFECVAMRDSLFNESLDSLFPHISVDDMNHMRDQYMYDKKSKVEFTVTCLLVNTGRQLVLVDTGWGGENDRPEGRTYAGMLNEKLSMVGVSCSEIDVVLHTHGHPDHIGGNADVDNRPVFPNARYIMHRDEWNFWSSWSSMQQASDEKNQAMTMLKSVKRNLFNIRDNFDIVDSDFELLPGIRCIHTPGHTPGHVSFIFSSGDSSLVCVGDVFHHPIQLIRPDWFIMMDPANEQAVDSRMQILEYASKDNTMLSVCHFPFPGVGSVMKHGHAWLWSPLCNKD